MPSNFLEKLRENPMLAIAIGMGLGFALGLVGRLLRPQRALPDVLILSAK